MSNTFQNERIFSIQLYDEIVISTPQHMMQPRPAFLPTANLLCCLEKLE